MYSNRSELSYSNATFYVTIPIQIIVFQKPNLNVGQSATNGMTNDSVG